MARQRVRSRLGIIVVGLLGLVLVGAAAGAHGQFFAPTKDAKGAATLRACIQRTGSEENVGDLNVRVNACGGRRPLVIPLGTSAGAQGTSRTSRRNGTPRPSGTGRTARRNGTRGTSRSWRRRGRPGRPGRPSGASGACGAGRADWADWADWAGGASRRLVRCRCRHWPSRGRPRQRCQNRHSGVRRRRGLGGWRSLDLRPARRGPDKVFPHGVNVDCQSRGTTRNRPYGTVGPCGLCSLCYRRLTSHDCGPPSRPETSRLWPGQAAGPQAAAAATPPGARRAPGAHPSPVPRRIANGEGARRNRPLKPRPRATLAR